MNTQPTSSRSGRVTPRRGAGRGLGTRIVIALVMAGFAYFSYLSQRTTNEFTNEVQYISLTKEQEITMGFQAVPQMVQQFGGEERDVQAQAYIDEVGQRLVQNSFAVRSEYPFEFTLLADDQTINAFALPGGPIFITTALFNQLENESQLAGVLGHEIGHVIGRHGAARIAQQELSEGLTGAVVMAACSEGSSCAGTQQMAQYVAGFVSMKYGRQDELESDELGVLIMVEAGYDPRGMIGVMEILDAATSGNRPAEFMSTHPDPGNRIAVIQNTIDEIFPNGVPEGLIQ